MKHILQLFLNILRIPIDFVKKNQIHRSSSIGRNALVRNSIINKYVHVGPGCIINLAEIGNYSSIAPYVQIGGLEHPYWQVSTSTFLTKGSVRNRTKIGNDVWIGAGSIIKQGITIGDGAVVGAHSFVNKDVPPFAIVFGIPAKIYKYRFDSDIIHRIESIKYWELSPGEAKKSIESLNIKYD